MRIAKRNLKKQSQFYRSRNEHKVSYNNWIREIYWIGHLVKTNPISVSPQACSGDWKNKPNFTGVEMNAKSIITRGYEKYIGLDTWWKQTQSNAILFSPQIYLGVENPIWKNKANLRKAKMNVNIYVEREYENKTALGRRENKANLYCSPRSMRKVGE